MEETIMKQENIKTSQEELASVLSKYEVQVVTGKVTSNITSIKQVMLKKQEDIKNLVYTGTREDQLVMIKSDKAAVNKFKDVMKSEKSRVKKELLKTYDDFEKEANEVIDIAQDTYDDLNKRASVLDEERREEKRKQIREYYDTISEPLGDFADSFYKMVYNNSWENASASQKAYKDGLKEAVDNYTSGISTIEMMICDADIKDHAVAMFKNKLNATKALQYIAQETSERMAAKEQARLAMERVKAEAEEQARLAAERARAEAEEQARIAAEKAKAEAEEQIRLAAEKARAEAEEKARIEAERAKAEAEEQARIAAERARAEAEEQARIAVAKAKAEAEKQAGCAAERAKTKAETLTNDGHIHVEFLSVEEWKLVKEYCDLHSIFYRIQS